MNVSLQRRSARLATLQAQLHRHHPGQRLQHLRDLHNASALRLRSAMRSQLKQLRQRLVSLAHGLDTVSPLATLDRGYAIVTSADGQVLQNAKQVQRGDRITARLAKGHLICTVDDTQAS